MCSQYDSGAETLKCRKKSKARKETEKALIWICSKNVSSIYLTEPSRKMKKVPLAKKTASISLGTRKNDQDAVEVE